MSDLIERMRSLEQDHEPDGWPAVQMRDLSALCDLVEAAGGQSVQPAVGPEVTDEMIDAGAQRLVAWDDGSEWPDSCIPMVVAAARNDAERVLRSALNARADHIVGARKMVKGDVSTAGKVILLEGKTYERAIVVAFESDDDLRAAIDAGQCRFTVFGGEV